MLSLIDSSSQLNRRQLLRIGTLGLGGLTLSSLLQHRAALGAGNSDLLTGKSVIFVFQQGGPSQFETFDPKPEAPSEIRTVTGVTQTSVPGVIFGDTMSQLAKHADKLTILRSFQTNNGGHNIHPIVSAETLNANMGSLVSRVMGPTCEATGVPTNAVLFPQAVDDKVTKGAARGEITATGQLGAGFAPFVPGAGGQLQKDMRLNLDSNKFDDRRGLLQQIDLLREAVETDVSYQSLDKFQEQAFQVLLGGGMAKALDLSLEDPRTLARYDTSGYVKSHNWNQAARGKRGYYTGQAKTIGKLLLQARRLCEFGCGFVTVHADYEGVWDMHADGNNLNMKDGMEAVGRSFDHAIAAFIEDCEQRGIADKILLICTGEMGRTPRINKGGGRDHWGKLAPLLIYGGGSARGKIVGQSTRDGGEPAIDPQGVKNLVSTVLHASFDVGKLRLQPGLSNVAKLGEISPLQGVWA